MARAIDSEAAYRFLSEQLVKETGAFSKGVNKGLNIARSAMRNPDAIHTLTLPNEALPLISMSDEIPPHNERVLVYRPCMVDSDTGPYSVQWGWAAKRDGSHWARLPDRRPPEGEEDA